MKPYSSQIAEALELQFSELQCKNPVGAIIVLNVVVHESIPYNRVMLLSVGFLLLQLFSFIFSLFG